MLLSFRERNWSFMVRGILPRLTCMFSWGHPSRRLSTRRPYADVAGRRTEAHLLHSDVHLHVQVAQDPEGVIERHWSQSQLWSTTTKKAVNRFETAARRGLNDISLGRSSMVCHGDVVVRDHDEIAGRVSYAGLCRRSFDHYHLACFRTRHQQQAVGHDRPRPAPQPPHRKSQQFPGPHESSWFWTGQRPPPQCSIRR
jgi:hypothetical protein